MKRTLLTASNRCHVSPFAVALAVMLLPGLVCPQKAVLRQEVQQLTAVVQYLAYGYQHLDEEVEAMRKRVLLEVENIVLPQGRDLPYPGRRAE